MEMSRAGSTKRGSTDGDGGSALNRRLNSDSSEEFNATGVIFGFSTLTRFSGQLVHLHKMLEVRIDELRDIPFGELSDLLRRIQQCRIRIVVDEQIRELPCEIHIVPFTDLRVADPAVFRDGADSPVLILPFPEFFDLVPQQSGDLVERLSGTRNPVEQQKQILPSGSGIASRAEHLLAPEQVLLQQSVPGVLQQTADQLEERHIPRRSRDPISDPHMFRLRPLDRQDPVLRKRLFLRGLPDGERTGLETIPICPTPAAAR